MQELNEILMEEKIWVEREKMYKIYKVEQAMLVKAKWNDKEKKNRIFPLKVYQLMVFSLCVI